MDYKEVVRNILPKDLLNYFEVKDMKEVSPQGKQEDYFIITLEETNTLPLGLSENDYESKGFYKPRKVQDFPLRGKAVYLLIYRRRWQHKLDKRYIHRDFSLIAEGTKFTKELSDFLKQPH